MLFRLIGLTVALGEVLNPITRVVSLLQGLSDKIEVDGKAEEKLYDDFVCWCKTIESQKTKSNEVAAQRIADLEAYIDDIVNGRLEFTTEREDLAKEIAQLQNQLEEEKATRDQAHKDFIQAEAELDAALTALGNAITVLGDATADSKKGVLLDVRFALRKAFLTNKNHSVEYVEAMIDKALAPPANKDWDKMDEKKTTFNKEYKGRSFKIQGVLADMKTTFEDNLEQARKTERLAQEDYDKLRERKEATLANRKEAAVTLKEENAARDKTRAESEQERDDLKEQVANDEKILTETSDTCASKKEEFQERSRLRTEEVASISEAISVLRSDDARDLFKRSFDSQTPDFLQMTSRHVSKGCAAARNKKAIHFLRRVGSHRLRTLSFLVAGKADTSKFPDNVIEKIDSILLDLKKEGETDEKSKNECEKLRATKTGEAKDHSNAIDDNTEEIERQTELIQKFDASIKEKEENVKAIEHDVEQANEQRAKENAEFEASKEDDSNAVKLIEKAIEALKKFYEDNNLALVQQRKAAAPELEAGKAPPPPPSTWDESYGGEKESNQGVVAILTLIKTDVEKDITVAEDEEKKSVKLHEEFVTESESQIEKLNGQIDEAKVSRSDAKKTARNEETDRTASKDVLAKTIEAIKAEEPKCNFITINFDVRKTNRDAEKDGLDKAKAVLKGGNFGFLEC